MQNGVEIILVEDNPNDVRLALDAFEQHNLANYVHVLRDGVEALDYMFCKGDFATRVVAPSPKVILLDLKLPFIDGLEVLRRLKSEEKTKSIPIVVLTTSMEDADVSRAYALGANSYIVKPVEFEKFTSIVKELGYYWFLLNHPPVRPAFPEE